MYRIHKNNIITLIRGDSLKLKIDLTVTNADGDKELWQLEEGDILYFAIMEPNMSFDNAIIKKELTYLDYDNGDIYVNLEPEITVDLKPGTYYYSIKVYYDGILDTIISNTKFIVTE